MKLYIYSLDKTIYEGEADSVTLPSEEGELGILSHHVPLVTALKPGTIRYYLGDTKKEFPVSKGFAQINGNKTILLVE